MSDSNATADARPVKDFFINVLTQDIELLKTIPEFVDNSFDGADRITEEDDLSQFFIDISLDSEHLEIVDNCGGIPLDIAKEYAFRFGRSDSAQDVMNSTIGEYGVGMKRALFKLGSHFIVESRTEDRHFVIEVDVEEWKDDPDKWEFDIEFPLSSGSDPRLNLDQPGTRIYVDELNASVSDSFAKDSFESRLSEELTSKSHNYLQRDIEIILNGQNLTYRPVEMIMDEEFDPAFESFVYTTPDGEVDVTIQSGVGERDGEAAGWYVFCNGRLILEADKTSVTGWGADLENAIPNFHNQYYRFRGVVHFNSDDSGILPWNTTKTGVNEDAGVYKKAKQNMVSTARPVINFLNDVENQKREMELEEDETTPLEQRMDEAEKVDTRDIAETVSQSSEDDASKQNFEGPDPDEEEDEDDDEPSMRGITYHKREDRIRIVMEELGVNSAKAVGEKTFEYYWDLEDLEV